MPEEGPCPVHRAMELLQEKWVLHIVRALLEGPKGFNELSRAAGGCNAATLSHRLERLVALGLVHKTVHSTIPPRTSYRLTRAGRALRGVIQAIDRWARRYLVETR
ncbi:MAG: helix-turn-helix domain-containing protein [Armatimonadota bacterium]|nr:helix-turn-helix domain-containing protein [Armatimonadota bacterium]MDR7439302.1 helix-turn-helix domain-containing protein [Armatimonadota bacterium]MDR7561992.1 helix-turn-helix domain-containing protein [Armatimonadota bacterium]MDR7568160.1 helix-turn-helix domain-containing protein [Armatimonadota bacterium]